MSLKIPVHPADSAVITITIKHSHPGVLIVDDGPWFSKFARTIPEKLDYIVAEADSVEEGEKVLGESTDLLIADILMPAMPGFSIIASARRGFPGMKILAVFGNGRSRRFPNGPPQRVDPTLSKPFTPERLKMSVAFLLGVVRPAGFEPATSCSGGKRSIQLSYGRTRLYSMTERRDVAVLPF